MKGVRRTLLVLSLLFAAASASAQKFSVAGRIVSDDSVAVALVRVGLFGADSTAAVCSAETSVDGKFRLIPPRAGNYTLRANLLGFRPLKRSVRLTTERPRTDLGTLVLESLDRELGEAQVTALSQQLTIEADTFTYHTEAFRLPPGATLGALMKQMPGLEMDADGNLTFQGRNVNNILVNGKPFFENTQEAMANVTVDAVKDVKVYEKTDEEKEFKGNTDAEKQTVVDLKIKKEYMGNWSANADLGGGTHERYILKGFGTNFTARRRLSLYAQVNNISENQQADENGNWSNWMSGDGLYTYRSAGANFSWDNGRQNKEGGRLEATAYLSLRHNDVSRFTEQHAEQFLSDGGTLRTASKMKSWHRDFTGSANGHLVWNADSLRRLIFRIYLNADRDPSTSRDTTSSFHGDLPVYEQFYRNQGLAKQLSGVASLRYIRRLRRKGHSLEFSANYDFGDYTQRGFNFSQQRYFSVTALEPLHIDRQYDDQPSHEQNLNLRAEYSFPVVGKLEGEVEYSYAFRHGTSPRHLYNLDQYEAYRTLQIPLGYLPTEGDSLLAARDFANAFGRSKYETISFLRGELSGTWDKVDFSASIIGTYVDQHLYYTRAGQYFRPTRHDLRLSGGGRLNWKFVENGRMTVFYHGSKESFDLENRLPFTDTSNTLLRTVNNPNLRDAWFNQVHLRANYFDKVRGSNYNAFFHFNQRLHKPVTTQTVDAETGVRTTSMQNVNGTWNFYGNLGTEQRLDSAGHWKLRLGTTANFNRDKSFVGAAAGGMGVSLLGYYNIGPNVGLTWRDNISTVAFTAAYRFQATRYREAALYNQTGHNFEARLAPQIDLESGLKLSTSLHYYVNWNFADALMNHGQWLWNISASQSFLKDKRLTVHLEVQDLLHQRTSENSRLTATARTFSRTRTFLSYAMLHLVYRFSIGGKSAVQQRAVYGAGQMIVIQ